MRTRFLLALRIRYWVVGTLCSPQGHCEFWDASFPPLEESLSSNIWLSAHCCRLIMGFWADWVFYWIYWWGKEATFYWETSIQCLCWHKCFPSGGSVFFFVLNKQTNKSPYLVLEVLAWLQGLVVRQNRVKRIDIVFSYHFCFYLMFLFLFQSLVYLPLQDQAALGMGALVSPEILCCCVSWIRSCVLGLGRQAATIPALQKTWSFEFSFSRPMFALRGAQGPFQRFACPSCL